MQVILAGASGLVGGHVARLMVGDGLTCLVRRPVAGLGARQDVVDPVQWEATILAAKPEIAIATLGTTIRSAGSKAAFEAVDLTLLCNFAASARKAGARQFLMVSSVGANAGSSNFYLATKGKAEVAVQAMGFDRVDIFRPGLLRGNRAERRPGEAIAMAISPLTDALTPRRWDKYRSIAASQVAAAITRAVGLTGPGVFFHHNREMMAI